jgi:hypothetical protein
MGLQAQEKLSQNNPAFRPGALYQGLTSVMPNGTKFDPGL